MNVVPITLIGKPGCHLCDDARAVIEQVREELAAGGQETTLVERNILEDEALARKHSEEIPVVLVGTKRHAMWRVDAAKLSRAIERQALGPLARLRRG
ncbi:glutaredoxin [Leucobacter exalbidus]|uniref:Glutaredoxin n=1 Tax=Leucobacter exalbidus TaxID=662960 RepID=A0A940PVW8_9MICO|nr:glutaredoxin [Leucobacter exalbidus]